MAGNVTKCCGCCLQLQQDCSAELWRSVDVCIIGAGPAGLVVASALAGTGLSILVLESGHAHSDAASQTLNEAESSPVYGELRSTRHRQIGGTVNVWNTDVAGQAGAKYVPLDPIDFRARKSRTAAWPFGHAELQPYYERGQLLAGLGPFEYGATSWTSAERSGFCLDSSALTNAVYQFGTAKPFLTDLPARLAHTENVQLVCGATVVELRTSAAGTRVQSAHVVTAARQTQQVTARWFVLALGAIESARLLLASNSARPEGIGNRSGLVGLGFMEHPRDYALSLIPDDSDVIHAAAFYDPHVADDGTHIMGRLALREATLRDHDLPNASVTLLAAEPDTVWTRLHRLGQHFFGSQSRYPRGGAGWGTRSTRLPARFRLLVNLEQAPDARNRIVLGATRDTVGMPRVQVRWHWSRAEQAALDRLRQLIANELGNAGLGKVVIDERVLPNPRAHHHAGTLRMHDDPRAGVLDREGRAHDVENLYCAGPATFPTAGFANPMLTTIALSLRLADHLGTTVTRGG